ncbi:MAG: aspartyl/glutamyl-tRNA amidotransferase subunit A [Candidatus Magasanikbacteria bacterium RIFCSPHIGHO2_02_FULL_41_13]|uniref:Glutamyl-tRNA(Gln) amidotransferase subunit A n=1 Tax=Candidatus Magasanikbacteria bacterium RIFCSPHIGHO2_02_FULL_41_13 TaxID=1798676 RepID=A0A1F6M456_9BACT|nr:MAG: aspartyl/glutamyl-tRNA amidotransferase subunit A [Candidatus Magasanikbacteria bacterium RIFCSPHIGHO2_02_FULL_41_13]
MNLNELTIVQAQEGLKNKAFSSLELTEACVSQIEKRNPEINAYITVTADLARAEAQKADELIASGKQNTLTGIPFSVKDAICTAGVRSTGSAKILDNYIPPYDATVIKNIRDQGAVLLGKNNCDAFGHGASNENSMYGAVKNPHDMSKVAGGSSGGSAAAVADHQCIFSIAEDTGGSIRYPAALCGIVGLRPSYGRNSRFGIMPMASSLDTVGPMAKSVEDIALLMEIMAGPDPKDATGVQNAVPKYTEELKKDIRRLKVGIPKEYFEVDGMDAETKQIVWSKIESLQKEYDLELVNVSLPHTKYSIPVYYIVVPSEDSSNLGRLDGIRYGARAEGEDLYDVYAKTRGKGFPEEVKRRIMIGTYALSAGYYDAYYRKAQKVRTLIIRDFENVFNSVDVLITPTSPTPAFAIGEKINDPLAMYLADIFVGPAAVSGIPGLSIPAGKTKTGLPVGLQILGPRLKEEKVLNLGYWAEKLKL